MSKSFHENLKENIDSYIHSVYDASENFPKSEQYDSRSQLRRSAMSVMLNYVEGYARRQSKKDRLKFLKIAYGSLKESEYLIQFSQERKWIEKPQARELLDLSDKIGRMLWGTIDAHD